MKKKQHEERFDKEWKRLFPDLPLEREVMFSKKRKFRFDFAHLTTKVAIEINGGVWITSRHTTGSGLLEEYNKNNLAITEGWVVFKLAPSQIIDNVPIIGNFIKSKINRYMLE